MKKLILLFLGCCSLSLFSQNLELVKDFDTDIDGSDLDPEAGVVFNDLVIFRARTEGDGEELWVTDGSAEGTHILKDIHRKGFSSSPGGIVATEIGVFFSADDGIRGNELWLTDGTSAGTRMVKDIWPGSESGGPGSMFAYGDQLIFVADGGEDNGRAFWISDGTEDGTFEYWDPGENNGLGTGGGYVFEGKL
ncbi:MAG: hypothetical protein HRT74_09845, partial [Flavobacteriales bacterium]|nr:hypothetical protein [Flavobacteriales bacterium]